VLLVAPPLLAPSASIAGPRAPAGENIQVGPRPYYLINDMDDSQLKRKLQACADKPLRRSEFSIAHRGAPLQFPEHTREAYEAAYRMGAGVEECDVTFTKDRQLVCRHSQCDLHTTTDVLAIPELAAKCSQPFVAADPTTGSPAQAQCCTSDFTLEEFKRLRGKMDAANPMATNVADYMKGTPDWRTDLYAVNSGTLMTHKESIELFKAMGVKMTPELKTPSVPMPFQGDYTQADFAQQMIDEYLQAGVRPADVFPQSFLVDDIYYWIDHDPAFGRQAVYLDDIETPAGAPSLDELLALKARGVQIIAPPIFALLDVDAEGKIAASQYAKDAKAAGLDIITWSFERDGPVADGVGFYYQSVASAVNNDGDTMNALDVLARKVGVRGVFSDWPGSVTYYASCMGL
jgi:glycerophosphoryl diester phosphodiesterase